MTQNSKITTINASIRPDQRAMLVQHAKDGGFISLSEALRSVLDEWKRQRLQEHERSHQTAAQ